MTTPAQRKALAKVTTILEQYRNATLYFDAILHQYHYVHPELNVYHDKEKGRGIRVQKDIPAGTVLISNPTGLRSDLPPGTNQRQGNFNLGLHLYQRLTKFGFELDRLAIPNDTLGLEDDFSQPEFLQGDVDTRGAAAKQSYPLSEVFPVQAEFLCPSLDKMKNYPNPLLYTDEKGQPQHIPLSIPQNLDADLSNNLINAMKDKKKGYPLLLRAMYIAQENSVLTPYNMPFLLPHMFVKLKPNNDQANKDRKVAATKKSTPKIAPGKKAKATAAVKAPAAAKVPEPTPETDTEAESEFMTGPYKYNFLTQIAEDCGLEGNDIPAPLLRSCPQLILGENDDNEDEDDEEEEEEKPQPIKNAKGGKKQQQEEQSASMESFDSLCLFPTFSLLNHDCSPNTTPLFFHIPSPDFLTKLYKEHKEQIAANNGEAVPFNLPREASIASCAVVVALRDIKAGEELSINYTPLAHCESSAQLTAAGTPVIQYIPWMQEFRQSQMKRIHSMLCTCNFCSTDLILQKALGATNAILTQDAEKALEDLTPLVPFSTVPAEIEKEFLQQDLTILAQRILLHTVILSEKCSSFNRNAIPLMLYRDRLTGGENETVLPSHPDHIVSRLRAITTHPLWNALFKARGGWKAVNTSTQPLSIDEIFGMSTSLTSALVHAMQSGRKDKSTVVIVDGAEESNEDIKNEQLLPIIVPAAFSAANETAPDAIVPFSIVTSNKATLVPTISALESTTSFASSIGMYAAVSSGYQRIQLYGVPEEEDADNKIKPETTNTTTTTTTTTTSQYKHPNSDESNLLIDGTVQPVGTSATETEEAMKPKPTHALVNMDDGSVLESSEFKQQFRELRALHEMVQLLEAVLCEVLGLNESEGRKEYILPTHWFVSTCLGLLHQLYIKLGARSEALIASLFLTYITGLSVPLSQIKSATLQQPKTRTPKEMRECKKIDDKWTYSQVEHPIPGSSVRPIHPSLVSLMAYFSQSLEAILLDVEIALQYAKSKISIHIEDQTDDGKEKLAAAKEEFEFAESMSQAVYFLGLSLEDYIV